MALSIEDLKSKIEEENKKLLELTKPIQNRIDRYYSMIKTLENKKVDGAPISTLLKLSGKTEKAYKALSDALPKGLYHSGWRYQEEEACFQVYLKRGDKSRNEAIRDTLLKDILPYLTYQEVNILRHDCGEDGSWKIFFEDGTFKIYDVYDYEYKYRKDICKPEFQSTNLLEILDYVSTNHWGSE